MMTEQDTKGAIHMARATLAQAEAALRLGDYEKAVEQLHAASRWADRAGERAAHVQTRLAGVAVKHGAKILRFPGAGDEAGGRL